jgi:sugar lactone lactonase YvrE
MSTRTGSRGDVIVRGSVRLRSARLAVVGAAAAAALAVALGPAGTAFADTAAFGGTVDNDAATSAPKSAVHPVSVPTPGTVSATLDWTGATANLTLILKLPDGTRAAIAATSDRPERITFEATTTGTYKLNVVAGSGGSPYTLTVDTPDVAGSPRYLATIGGPAHPDIAPSGIDVDDDGDVYVPSTANDEVVKYSAAGRMLWKVGARTGKVNGNFSNPRDIAVSGGAVYVADTGYNRVQVLDAATGAWRATWPHRYGAVMGISTGVDAGGAWIVLVSDSTSSTVKTYTPDGTLLRTVGGKGSTDGLFDQVRDAATDAAGNIYAADFKNQRVQVFSPNGTYLRQWGTSCVGTCPTPAPGQFKEPYGIDVDAAGDVYVSDNRRVQKFTPLGEYLTEYGVTGTGPDELFQLRRVAVGAGTSPAVYAADLWGFKVLQYSQGGTITGTYGGVPPAHGGFNQPYGLALNGDTLYVADTNNQRIEMFSASTGAVAASWGERGFGKDNLNGQNWPRGVTYNAATNTVWVADTKNYRVVERNVDGTPTGRVFGSTGSVLLPSILNWVYGIASYGPDVIVADTFGNKIGRWTGNDATTPVWTATGFNNPKAVTVAGDVVYVADSVNHRIVTLDARDGRQLGVLGEDVLHRVEGIAVAPSGNIWVADTSYNRVVELSPTGALLQSFGKKGAGTSQFNLPTQLAIGGTDTSTRLYVTDTNNDRVQVFDIS